MHTKKMTAALWPLLTLLITGNTALASDSSAFAAMGKTTWKSFGCSALAGKSGNHQEQARLFLHGYTLGHQFIHAAQAGKITKGDFSKKVPQKMLQVLEGPSPDFMLGRVFDKAVDAALRNVLHTGGSSNSDEQQRSIAKNNFQKLDCKGVGQ